MTPLSEDIALLVLLVAEARQAGATVDEEDLQQELSRLRELRARRVAMGRNPDDDASASADMCCCNACLIGHHPHFVDGCPMHPHKGGGS